MKQIQDRRQFLTQLAAATGAVVLVPFVSACGSTPAMPDVKPDVDVEKAATDAAKEAVDVMSIPQTKPEAWNAVAYNKARGNAGAIPESYWPSINGPDGDNKHLGKHLPFVPTTAEGMVPAGYLALMWGNPELGHAKHPNAPKSEGNPTGHWYNWIKIRKAVEGETEELQSQYSDWPGIVEGDTGAYAVAGGGDMTEDGGKNAIYLAALPEGLQAGDTIRIHAHCLTHGEYVDFLTI